MFLIGYHFSRKNIIFEGDALNKVSTPPGKNDKKNYYIASSLNENCLRTAKTK